MTTRTRPTMKSTLQNYDFTPVLYRSWTIKALQGAIADYEQRLVIGDSDIEWTEVTERRLSQLRRELGRRQ